MGKNDSLGATYSIVVRSNNVVVPTLGRSVRTRFLDTHAFLRLTTKYYGALNASWHYITVFALADYNNPLVQPLPFRPDTVTVDYYTQAEDASGVYDIYQPLESLSSYYSWRHAESFIVITSGGQYGGRCKIDNINFTTNKIRVVKKYKNDFYHEAVHLIPMVAGSVVACTVSDTEINTEMKFNPRIVLGA